MFSFDQGQQYSIFIRGTIFRKFIHQYYHISEAEFRICWGKNLDFEKKSCSTTALEYYSFLINQNSNILLKNPAAPKKLEKNKKV